MPAPRRVSGAEGFTLVEVLVAMAVLAVGVLGSVAVIDGVNAATLATGKRQASTNLSRQITEAAQGLPYSQVSQSGVVAALQAKPGLGDSEPGTEGWQVSRGGVTHTVSATVCKVDDPKDGRGAHDSSFCADSPSGSEDSEPDDYRRVSVEVSWNDGVKTRQARRTALVLNRRTSASPAPAATAISIDSCSPTAGCHASALAQAQIGPCYGYVSTSCYLAASTSCGSNCATSVSFQVTTTGSPASVKWAVDGEVKGEASGSGNSWSFSWSLGSTYPQNPADGTYEVSAQAYDAAGNKVGGPTSKTVTLNRFLPDMTAFTIMAGRNALFSNYPESELYPTGSNGARLDRDLYYYLTYRWYKQNGPNVKTDAVCASTTSLFCQDTSPPNNLDWYQFQVLPTDRVPSGELRVPTNYSNCDGADPPLGTCSRNVVLANTRPNPPSGLTLSSSGGETTLSWTLPSGTGDPDTGDYVDGFRIYRDGTLVTSRYDRTPFGTSASGGTSTSWTDHGTGGTSHTYRITSVDTRQSESTLVGPVTG